MDDKGHCSELLDALEEGVLELDRPSDQDQMALIHKLFQSSHNLKSTLALAGLTRASKLVHTLEDALDAIRRGREGWSATVSDRTFAVIDVVRTCLQAESDASVNLDALQDAPAATPSRVVPSMAIPGIKLTELEVAALAAAISRGERVYRIEKLFGPGLGREDFEGHMILDDIRSMGTLLAMVPPYEGYAAAAQETVVRYIFSTVKTTAELEELFFDPLIPMSGPALEPGREVTAKLVLTKVPPPAHVPAELRILIVEDDFTCRVLLSEYLRKYGVLHVAINGAEAVQAVRVALAEGLPYDLICLDIMMPEMDGQHALKLIRQSEEAKGILSSDGAKIIMTTALGTLEHVKNAYASLCDGYLVKPLYKAKLEEEMRKLGLRA